MRQIALFKRQGRPYGILLIAAALACCAARNATAAIEFSISSLATTVAAGSINDSFDVTLTNTGRSALELGGFAFELTTTGSLITFTSATTSTSIPYVFAGSSVFGPLISYSSPGSVLDALDMSLIGGSVGAGDTVALGHVLFDVSAAAPTSVVPLTFTGYPVTSLSDTSGDNLGDIFSLSTNAVIDIQGSTASVVPEPSASIVWVGCGVLGLIGYARRRQQRPAFRT
jgi:hypothetical protein